MADTHDKKTRSYNMSMIKGKNTKPEIIVRKILHRNGFRYLLNNKKLPGKPDIVMPKYKTVIFVNGCFWHGHENCKYYKLPLTNADWWDKKISETKLRDLRAKDDLIKLNWRIIEIWECELKKPGIENTLNNLVSSIKDSYALDTEMSV